MMKILLDTHIALWALSDDERLPILAKQLIDNKANTIMYSVISPWEVQIKHSNKPDRMPLDAFDFIASCGEADYHSLPVTNEAVLQLGTLSRSEESMPHNDPFDRIMICQAKANDLVFLTHDAKLDGYNEPCVLCV